MQLRNVVELAGMIAPLRLRRAGAVRAATQQTLRPDLIVNLPGGKHVVVDAKAPLQGVLDAYEAPTRRPSVKPPPRSRAVAAHARQGARGQGLLGRSRVGA